VEAAQALDVGEHGSTNPENGPTTFERKERFTGLVVRMDTEDASLASEQARLDRMLTRGFVYSIVWLAGLGSCYALFQGLRARRMIKLNPALRGNDRAWWCLIVGGVGVAVPCTIAAIAIFNAVTQP